MWLGSIHPRGQCAGGMLLVQWCCRHVLNCLMRTRRCAELGVPRGGCTSLSCLNLIVARWVASASPECLSGCHLIDSRRNAFLMSDCTRQQPEVIRAIW